MSLETGAYLPDDLLRFFTVEPPEKAFNQVIQVTTIDSGGWPRHAMLSRWEVVARSDRLLLMLLYRSSRTAKNIRRTGRVTLAVVNSSMSYYLFCSANRRAALSGLQQAALFELATKRVLQDVLPTARIVSGTTFEGFDDAFDPEIRAEAYRKLLSVDLRRRR